MLRNELSQSISHYKEHVLPILANHPSFSADEENNILDRFCQFVESTPDCFDRKNTAGHITGSAFVVNSTADQVVLTLHRKLDIWLQLGGHADNEHKIDEVALRETTEESGLEDLEFISPLIGHNKADQLKISTSPIPFDFDIHLISARKDEPEHYHYDVRYLIQAKDNELQISDESKDLQWFALDQARSLNTERSMIRPFDKLSSIIKVG